MQLITIYRATRHRKICYQYQPTSIWSNILFILFTLFIPTRMLHSRRFMTSNDHSLFTYYGMRHFGHLYLLSFCSHTWHWTILLCAASPSIPSSIFTSHRSLWKQVLHLTWHTHQLSLWELVWSLCHASFKRYDLQYDHIHRSSPQEYIAFSMSELNSHGIAWGWEQNKMNKMKRECNVRVNKGDYELS